MPYSGDKRVVLKALLDLYLTVTKDDNVTEADVLIQFETPESEVKDLIKKYHVIITLGRNPETDNLAGSQKIVIGSYNVEVWTTDRPGATGWKIREKAKREIRRVFKDHPASVQVHQEARDEDMLLGSPKLYHTVQTVEYWSYDE